MAGLGFICLYFRGYFGPSHWPTILKHSIIPHITFSRDQIMLICAILGTTITPYLFFWQTSQEIEDEIAVGQNTIKQRMGSLAGSD